MEICEQSEVFVEEGDDYVFDHTKFILKEKENGNYFYSEIKSRLDPSVPFDINKLQPIPMRNFWPPFDRSLTRAPNPLPGNHYIKTPSLVLQRWAPLGLDYYLQKSECGIRHLHALGLVHNDINPRNFMVSEDDRPVIIDFDSCKEEG
jgi:serine/threonine protein kinase